MITSFTSPFETTGQNRIVEHVFNRFEIDPNSSGRIIENTVLIGVDPNFLVDVLNVFCSYKEVNFCLFAKYPVPIILDYLKRSHRYYMEKILPEIGQSIAILLSDYHEAHPLLEVLYKFYFKYKVDLKEHFSEEEELLFPYANMLYKTKYFKTEVHFFINLLQQYSINDFIETHDDTVEDLTTVKNILLAYEPPLTNKSSYRVLVEQLKNFEQDLHIHAFIEDKVLVPKLYQLEQRLKLEINN